MNSDEHIRRPRKNSPRAESIAKIWRTLDQESGLSTREKLERLIRLSGPPSRPKPEPRRAEQESRPPYRIFENHFHPSMKYGRVLISAGLSVGGDVLRVLGRESNFSRVDLSSALFLDLETSGVSGGVGVVPFLIGLGFYRDGGFHISQFFLSELAEEDGFLRELSRFLSGLEFQAVVTFNGKVFDLPLLETRFLLHREPFPLQGLPHLDFLFPARSLWSHRQESCRLTALARDVLGAEREGDIPPDEIPLRYFEYLRSGDFSLIEPILSHNQEDLLSLLGVVIIGASCLSGPALSEEAPASDALDLFGAARVLEKAGETERFLDFMHRALEGRLPEDIAVRARKKLAEHFKKQKRWDHAVGLWKEMLCSRELSCYRELAMYYEHKIKDYAKAAELAEQALDLASGISPSYQADFRHRLNRLRSKLSRQKGEGGGR